MSMNVNTLLTLLSTIIFSIVVALMYFKAKKNSETVDIQEYTDMDKVLEAVKNDMVELIKEDYTLGLSDTEFDKLYKRKARINEALKNCVYGIDSAKALVIDLIRGFIADNVPVESAREILGLDATSEPSNQVKFEILMYKYKKMYEKDALAKLIDEEGWANERTASFASSPSDKAYFVTIDDLNYAYSKRNYVLSDDEVFDVLAVLVYQQYKGFGVVDTIREMNINGVNMGTSGSILSATTKNNEKFRDYKANNSVWIYYDGKYIHLRFINFGTEEELRRIIQLICRWNNPGPLTAKRGYLVNTMYDKSRVLAVRPPVSEYWAVFLRKFNISDPSPEFLILKDYVNNGMLQIKMLEFLMRGQITCAVTGRQGSGKTTLMSSIIRYIDPRYTIRVLELAPELYLRELYPSRNILSLQETNTVSASECQDALKKSDAAVSIVGEVATDSVAARMIQMGMTASIFTIFSHHANTPKDLVLTLRNSLINDGGFTNMETAEKQVTDVVRVDVHLDFTVDGRRYIQRVSEIIQLEEGIPYPEYDPSNPEDSMAKITREYYTRKTDRVGFRTNLIMHYDLDTNTYVADNRFSKETEEKLRAALTPDMRAEFDLFMLQNWGPRKDNADEVIPQYELDKLEEELNAKWEKYKEEQRVSLDKEKQREKEIEQDNAFRQQWKEEYATQADSLNEYNLGAFFQDDDY